MTWSLATNWGRSSGFWVLTLYTSNWPKPPESVIIEFSVKPRNWSLLGKVATIWWKSDCICSKNHYLVNETVRIYMTKYFYSGHHFHIMWQLTPKEYHTIYIHSWLQLDIWIKVSRKNHGPNLMVLKSSSKPNQDCQFGNHDFGLEVDSRTSD